MTSSNGDRLNRIEHLVESNARAIQAQGDLISELTHDIDGLTEAGRQAQEERARATTSNYRHRQPASLPG